jgi:hypothetical protein
VAGLYPVAAGGSRKRPLVRRRPSVSGRFSRSGSPNSERPGRFKFRGHSREPPVYPEVFRRLDTDELLTDKAPRPTQPRGLPDIAFRLARRSLPEFQTTGRSREFQTMGEVGSFRRRGEVWLPSRRWALALPTGSKKIASSKAKRGQRKNKDSKRDTVNAEESPSPALQPAGQQSQR